MKYRQTHEKQTDCNKEDIEKEDQFTPVHAEMIVEEYTDSKLEQLRGYLFHAATDTSDDPNDKHIITLCGNNKTQSLDCRQHPYTLGDSKANDVLNMFNYLRHPLLDVVVE